MKRLKKLIGRLDGSIESGVKLQKLLEDIGAQVKEIRGCDRLLTNGTIYCTKQNMVVDDYCSRLYGG